VLASGVQAIDGSSKIMCFYTYLYLFEVELDQPVFGPDQSFPKLCFDLRGEPGGVKTFGEVISSSGIPVQAELPLPVLQKVSGILFLEEVEQTHPVLDAVGRGVGISMHETFDAAWHWFAKHWLAKH
jgi:hypothetical protein